MTPVEFLEEIVRPNVAEFRTDQSDMRHAYNAVAAVDGFVAHIYVWCLTNAPAEVAGLLDDTAYRNKLAERHADFGLLRDISKAQKHVKLNRGAPIISNAAQIVSRPVGYGEGPYGHGGYGGPQQVVIDIDTTTMTYVGQIIDSALEFLEGELARMMSSDSAEGGAGV
jgi:hypothetical protein